MQLEVRAGEGNAREGDVVLLVYFFLQPWNPRESPHSSSRTILCSALRGGCQGAHICRGAWKKAPFLSSTSRSGISSSSYSFAAEGMEQQESRLISQIGSFSFVWLADWPGPHAQWVAIDSRRARCGREEPKHNKPNQTKVKKVHGIHVDSLSREPAASAQLSTLRSGRAGSSQQTLFLQVSFSTMTRSPRLPLLRVTPGHQPLQPSRWPEKSPVLCLSSCSLSLHSSLCL